ncbi:Mur ligase family protein [Arenivirga flava]|uniref:Mur ligase family protein n=1 Tax=Arenivirga flava TaxID=1930060 RepID=UPI0032AECE7B
MGIRPEHPSARSLAALVEDSGVEVCGSVQGVEVTGVSLSSREVLPGDLYVALRGDRAHGAAYAAQARDAGAVAIVTDAEGAELAADAGLPVLVVDEPRLALGDLAAWVYQTDELRPTLFGVTGTNGKTSTSYLLDGLLRQLGLTTGLSTTAERRAGDLVVEAKLTTPEAPELHALLARMRESEVRAAVIEVSSHALGRHRIDGLLFDVVGFTNLSHDHLDEYADMDEYFGVKLQLFHPDHAKRGVASLDTPWGSACSRSPASR